jgi:hypothetical protein
MIDNEISNNNTAQAFGSGRSDFGSYGFSDSKFLLKPSEVPPRLHCYYPINRYEQS